MAMVKAVEPKYKKKQTAGMKFLTILFAVVSVIYVMPVIIVLYNSFKANSDIATNLFALPNADTFYGLQNYIKGMTFGNYPFWEAALWSLLITVGGVVLILFCTSMAAWYIQRSNTIICKIIYFFCIFSMVVPFQMVMFTLSDTANSLKLVTPWGILLIYLGFGAGLAIFMFSGVLPIMKPTFISVAILETMWIWNDYLLPYLILDGKLYRTIPIHMQFLNGSYGQTDNGAIMALVVLSILPIVIFYFACQKYIIEGVVSGAVKG